MPIVSFVGKGADEIIKNKFNGFLVENNNISEFINKIYQIKQNKVIISDMQNNCLESIRKFDLNANSNKLINIYNNQI